MITGKTPTRTLSTSPAVSRLRHRLTLPRVRSETPASSIARTSAAASVRTSRQLPQVSGASRVEENTTLVAAESSSMASFSASRVSIVPSANEDISR